MITKKRLIIFAVVLVILFVVGFVCGRYEVFG